jgi:hypothetical protein
MRTALIIGYKKLMIPNKKRAIKTASKLMIFSLFVIFINTPMNRIKEVIMEYKI